jgi:hypothetical protein
MSSKAVNQKEKIYRVNYSSKAVAIGDKHRVLFMQKVMGLNECIEYLQNQKKKKAN